MLPILHSDWTDQRINPTLIKNVLGDIDDILFSDW